MGKESLQEQETTAIFSLNYCQKSRLCIYVFVWTVRVRFEWNAEKDRANQRKHRISFTTATRVFEDPDYVTEQDREVESEERWQTIGKIGAVLILMVAHTVSDENGDLVFHIISARRATAHERRHYEANTN